MMNSKLITLLLSFAGLFCLLSYTFVHTGNVLAGFVRPSWIGFVAAFGIELLVALMAWRYAQAKRSERTDKFLRFALIATLFVSALANLTEGFHVRYQTDLSWAEITQIGVTQFVIAVAMTGLIPVLVFAVTDLLASDVNKYVKQVQPKANKELVEDEQTANSVQNLVFALLQEREHTVTELSNHLGIAKSTASKWRSKFFEGNGKAH